MDGEEGYDNASFNWEDGINRAVEEKDPCGRAPKFEINACSCHSCCFAV